MPHLNLEANALRVLHPRHAAAARGGAERRVQHEHAPREARRRQRVRGDVLYDYRHRVEHRRALLATAQLHAAPCACSVEAVDVVDVVEERPAALPLGSPEQARRVERAVVGVVRAGAPPEIRVTAAHAAQLQVRHTPPNATPTTPRGRPKRPDCFVLFRMQTLRTNTTQAAQTPLKQFGKNCCRQSRT